MSSSLSIQGLVKNFEALDTSKHGVIEFSQVCEAFCGIGFPESDVITLLKSSGTCKVHYKDFIAWVLKEHVCGSGGRTSLDCGRPSPPPGMALTVTDAMKARQTQNPRRWTMKIQQWLDVVKHCEAQPLYQDLKAKKGFVSMTDINRLFVIPWTKGTGCSLSVLMSQEKETAAGLMVSHAWDEDVEELRQALVRYVDEKRIASDTAIWFCVFSNYQAEDDEGPSIAEQIGMRPFADVIESEEVTAKCGGHGMVAVHTTKADLYGRFWCVHEVDRALEKNLSVGAAMSDEYIKEMVRRVKLFLNEGASTEEWQQAANIAVNTSKAKCRSFNDELMLLREVKSKGSFDRLDKAIRAFRLASLPKDIWLAAVQTDGLLLQEAPQHIKADREVVRHAIEQNSCALHYVPAELWADNEFVLQAREQIRAAIQAEIKHGEYARGLFALRLAKKVDVKVDSPLHLQSLETGVNALALDVTAGILFSGSYDQSIRAWNTSTAEKLQIFSGHTDTVFALALDSTASTLYSGSDDQSIRAWNTSTAEQLQIFSGHTDTVFTLALDSTAGILYSGSDDRSIRAWNTATAEQLQIFSGYTGRVSTLALDSTAGILYSGSDGQSIRAWNTSTAEQLRIFSGHTCPVSALALDSTAGILYSGSHDQSIRAWNTSTAEQLRIFSGHTRPVFALALDSTAGVLYSGSFDQSIRAWITSTAEQLQIFSGHIDIVCALALDATAGILYTGSADKSVRAWSVLSAKHLAAVSAEMADVDAVVPDECSDSDS